MGKRSQVEILGKRIFWVPNGSPTPWPSRYWLHALTTELWETRGEQGHVVIIYTLSKSPMHLSFIRIYHFDMLSLAVWQDTCHRYKNLHVVYDLAHHESPIAQWFEHPTCIWKVMGSTPVGGSENSFSEYFNLRTLLHYWHFIEVTNPFIAIIFVWQEEL